jgi:hypothetical protein
VEWRGRGRCGSSQGESLYAKRPKRLCGRRSTGVQQRRLAVRVTRSVGERVCEEEGADKGYSCSSVKLRGRRRLNL